MFTRKSRIRAVCSSLLSAKGPETPNRSLHWARRATRSRTRKGAHGEGEVEHELLASTIRSSSTASVRAIRTLHHTRLQYRRHATAFQVRSRSRFPVQVLPRNTRTTAALSEGPPRPSQRARRHLNRRAYLAGAVPPLNPTWRLPQDGNPAFLNLSAWRDPHSRWLCGTGRVVDCDRELAWTLQWHQDP